MPEEQPNWIRYSIDLLNPDSLGNPREHFGDQETGCVVYCNDINITFFVNLMIILTIRGIIH